MKNKKVLYIIGCALGAGFVGFFANRLTTSVFGAVMFAIGVFLMVVCINSVVRCGEKEE